MQDFIEEQGELEQALMTVDRFQVKAILKRYGDQYPPFTLIEKLIGPVMDRIGENWTAGKASLSQVYMSGKICEEYVESLLPGDAAERIHQPSMGIAVLEDFHALGKRVVYSVLRANGYVIKDYGAGISVEEMIKRAQEDRLRILLISTLMLPSALRIRQLRDGLDANGVDCTLVVGGAPFRFDPELSSEVGADATGASATEALQIINRMREGWE